MSSCFYEKGLRFECQNCNYCCGAEPGYVFLSEEDIKKLSESFAMNRQQFLDTYCRYVDMGMCKMISLCEKENYDCIFLENKRCLVYNRRPCQCETYPFWAHILESSETWEEEAKACPGIGNGKLYTKKEIEAKLSSRHGNNPVMLIQAGS